MLSWTLIGAIACCSSHCIFSMLFYAHVQLVGISTVSVAHQPPHPPSPHPSCYNIKHFSFWSIKNGIKLLSAKYDFQVSLFIFSLVSMLLRNAKCWIVCLVGCRKCSVYLDMAAGNFKVKLYTSHKWQPETVLMKNENHLNLNNEFDILWKLSLIHLGCFWFSHLMRIHLFMNILSLFVCVCSLKGENTFT